MGTMPDPTQDNVVPPQEFITAYVIQTRTEVDTEKQSRDKLMHYAVLLIGGLFIAVFQDPNNIEHLKNRASLLFSVPILCLISSLFWLRWKKFAQISDRWFALKELLTNKYGDEEFRHLLEWAVTDRLRGWRYLIKDIVLNLTACGPVYGVIIWGALNGGWLCVGLFAVVLHILASTLTLSVRMKDPFEKKN